MSGVIELATLALVFSGVGTLICYVHKAGMNADRVAETSKDLLDAECTASVMQAMANAAAATPSESTEIKRLEEGKA